MPDPADDHPDPDPDHGWQELSWQALQHAILGDPKAAAGVIHEMTLANGDDSLPRAMLAWIDTAIAAAGWTRPKGMPIQLGFLNDGTGRLDFNADNVRPGAVWAARLIGARLADDEATYRAVFQSMPHDPHLQGEYVMELLTAAALTARGKGAAVVMRTERRPEPVDEQETDRG